VRLVLPQVVYNDIIDHVLAGYPLEACGLLVGAPASDGTTSAVRFVPSPNLAASALVYTIDPKVHLRAERDADDDDLAVIGVVHSHTHTDPFPSPTDVAAAPDPTWEYVIVSLRDASPALRSYRIEAGTVTETPVVIDDHM
jgi:[CysO sulfur-carrier protein]-S-L-cysteine hydrolase